MTDYALKLSEDELARYQYMAESAAEKEVDMWAAAGVVAGAAVADVGCGPGAMSAVLARLVGPTGHVRAVDRDSDAVAAAQAAAQRAGLANLTVSVGDADDTGLEPGCVDVVMMRHVLAHNGGREQAVVDHLKSLVRPGGSVYLVDTDYSGVRSRPTDPDLADIAERYGRWHRDRGNDLSVGLRLGELLLAAGLEDVQHHGRYDVFSLPPGARHPSWAGRDALMADGLATEEDIERWDAAFVRTDALQPRPVTFVPMFLAFGRRPTTA